MTALAILDSTDATDIRECIEDAARWLYRSMETGSSMLRRECCLHAWRALLMASGLADGEERAILAAHCRQVRTLAEQFYGDGRGVGRLLDELQALAEVEQ